MYGNFHLKTKNEFLASKYREILLYADGLTTFEISHDVSEMSSRLRAKYSIRTPDAIQIAVGIIHGADSFLTNDSSLKRVKEIKTEGQLLGGWCGGCKKYMAL